MPNSVKVGCRSVALLPDSDPASDCRCLELRNPCLARDPSQSHDQHVGSDDPMRISSL